MLRTSRKLCLAWMSISHQVTSWNLRKLAVGVELIPRETNCQDQTWMPPLQLSRDILTEIQKRPQSQFLCRVDAKVLPRVVCRRQTKKTRWNPFRGTTLANRKRWHRVGQMLQWLVRGGEVSSIAHGLFPLWIASLFVKPSLFLSVLNVVFLIYLSFMALCLIGGCLSCSLSILVQCSCYHVVAHLDLCPPVRAFLSVLELFFKSM